MAALGHVVDPMAEEGTGDRSRHQPPDFARSIDQEQHGDDAEADENSVAGQGVELVDHGSRSL